MAAGMRDPCEQVVPNDDLMAAALLKHIASTGVKTLGYIGGVAGMVPNKNGAVTSAVLVHLRVEPAHFDWRWWERPALALLAWEAMARDPLTRLRRIQGESIGTKINFRPAAITHRDIAASALLIASRLALTARKKSRRLVDPQGYEGPDEAHN
jgi:hypothetical protein